MAHVATPEVVAPTVTPAEDDAAAPAIIAPPEDDASNKPKRPRKASFPEKLVQLLQEELDVIRSKPAPSRRAASGARRPRLLPLRDGGRQAAESPSR